jgi:hypothetical protein
MVEGAAGSMPFTPRTVLRRPPCGLVSARRNQQLARPERYPQRRLLAGKLINTEYRTICERIITEISKFLGTTRSNFLPLACARPPSEKMATLDALGIAEDSHNLVGSGHLV